MMVAAVIVGGELALAVDGAAELAAPDDQRVVEQAALLEVGDQGRRRLVGVAALRCDLLGQVAVLVPAAMKELHEPHAPLAQPPGQQAVGGEGAGRARLGAVQLENVRRLVRHVGQLGHRGLHAVGHLVLRDARGDLRVAELVAASAG